MVRGASSKLDVFGCVRESISKACSRMRDVHFLLGTPKLAKQTCRWAFVREFGFLYLDLDNFSPPAPPRHEIRFSEYTDKQLAHLLQMNPALNEEEINGRMNSGKKCILGWIGNEPVIYRWHCDSVTHLDFLNLSFIPKPGQICITETYVPMKNRKQGINESAAILNLMRLKKLGYKSVLGFAATWHYPTRHLLVDILGYVEVGSVVFRPMAPFGRYKLKGSLSLDPDGHLRLTDY